MWSVFSGISHYSEASNHKSNNPKRKLKTSDQMKSEFISHILWRNFWDKLHMISRNYSEKKSAL